MEQLTINLEEIAQAPDHSITDAETIRQIALHSLRNNELNFISKIDPRFRVYGLYPERMKAHNILPDNVTVNQETLQLILDARKRHTRS